jgi:MFS family permease
VLIPSLLGQPYLSLLPVFARDVLEVGPTGQGLLLTALGAGALCGAVLVATIGNTGRQGLLMLSGALVFGVSIVAFGASPWFSVCMVLMAINGLCNVSYGTQANTLLQLHTRPELRGRVLGVYFSSRGLQPLGSLLAGSLAATFGAQRSVELMGLSCALIALWVWAAAPEVRQLR